MYQTHERWGLVADVSRRQLDLEDGPGKVETVIRLANAYDQAGTPSNARERMLGFFSSP